MDRILSALKKLLLLFLVLSTVLIWYAVFYFESHQNLLLTFFDVGQGDSIFIEASNGNQVLVDGGPGDKVLAKLGRKLPFWDRSLDLLILTHAHADHVGGLLKVLERYDIGAVLESGEAYSTPEYQEWHKLIQEKNIPVFVARRGQVVYIGEKVRLDVLSPFEDYNGVSLKNPHDANVSTKLIFGKISALLMGDAEKPVEYRLIESNPGELKSDILKVGHHGSKTSSSEDFLKAVSPQFAVVQVGRKNRYGHPTQEVLDRLSSLGIKILRTDLDGDLGFISDGRSLVQN